MTELDSSGSLLLVDDDHELNQLVVQFLTKNGFNVLVETDGSHAVERIIAEQPQLVILDIMLPGQDGLSICRRVRTSYRGPILMLTALGEDIDEVAGLETGADDYLAKPVRPRVLLARIRALLRRSQDALAHSLEEPNTDPRIVADTSTESGIPTTSTITVGDLTLVASSRLATLNNQPLLLTDAEFDLLWLLTRQAGRVISRDSIYRHLRGLAHDGLDRTIDQRISRLRKKLGDNPKQPQRIKSVRGIGYLFAT